MGTNRINLWTWPTASEIFLLTVVFRYLVTMFVLVSVAIKKPQWAYCPWEYIWLMLFYRNLFHACKKTSFEKKTKCLVLLDCNHRAPCIYNPSPVWAAFRPHKLTFSSLLPPHTPCPTQSIAHLSSSSQTHTTSHNCKHTHMYRDTPTPSNPTFQLTLNLYDRSNRKCSLVNSSSFHPVITHSCGL